jgi:hypothetical protein
MWARVIEAMLGCWLAMSPFVFRLPGSETTLWTLNLVGAVVVILLSLLSYWQPTQYAHLVTLFVALFFIAFGRLAESEPSPPLQNLIFVGLLLLMFAMVPNHASQPPRGWREVAEASNKSV